MKFLSKIAATLIVGCVAAPLCNKAAAQGAPCPQGLKGIYASWTKNSATVGQGSFTAPANQVAVLPDFNWEVTGVPLSVAVGDDEPFGGGNSMADIYGAAADATNLNIRIKPNEVDSGDQIPHSAVLTIRFEAGTPASGWGFAVVDFDVDQVRFRAKDSSGAEVPISTLAGWFVQRFDANPTKNGVNLPSWDSQMAAVIGSESSSNKWRTTVEGGLTDSEAGSVWFQPDVSLSEISFEYQSLQESANPSYHVLIASCATDNVEPTPTPSASDDSDGDMIPDATEGSADPDNDEVPNYLDKDSDNDTILDSTEGTGDPDGDGDPNYLDQDSDNDNVPDQIERDPDATTDTSTGEDDNRDGVDDGDSDKTNQPPDDSDGDSVPDYLDPDSDNDGQTDGQEAYDLDGDGDRDVEPSGEDLNNNGFDDTFEHFDSPEDINSRFSGDANESICKSVSPKRAKRSIRTRLAALANRVPLFSQRATSCGGNVPPNLSTDAQVNRRSMEQRLNSGFPDAGLICPVSVCAAAPASRDKAALQALATQLYKKAKTAKLLAIKACGSSPDSSNRKRPSTETYYAQLSSEISKLPRKLSDCDSSNTER